MRSVATAKCSKAVRRRGVETWSNGMAEHGGAKAKHGGVCEARAQRRWVGQCGVCNGKAERCSDCTATAMRNRAAARRDNVMFGSAKARLCKVIRDIAKAKRGRSMCNKARALRGNVPLRHGQDRNAKAKYSQAETSEGIARKRSAAAEQGETWQRQGEVQKCGVEATQ